MLQWRALEMSAQHAARPRHRGIFIRRLLGRAGVAEAVEVVVAILSTAAATTAATAAATAATAAATAATAAAATTAAAAGRVDPACAGCTH